MRTNADTAKTDGGVMVNRPRLVESGAISPPAPLSSNSGATRTQVSEESATVTYVWNGAVNGDTANARRPNARIRFSINACTYYHQCNHTSVCGSSSGTESKE